MAAMGILLLIIGTIHVQGKIGIWQKKILIIPIFKTQTSFICPWWTTTGCILAFTTCGWKKFFSFFWKLELKLSSFKLGWALPGWAHPLGLRHSIPLLLGLTGIYSTWASSVALPAMKLVRATPAGTWRYYCRDVYSRWWEERRDLGLFQLISSSLAAARW